MYLATRDGLSNRERYILRVYEKMARQRNAGLTDYF